MVYPQHTVQRNSDGRSYHYAASLRDAISLDLARPCDHIRTESHTMIPEPASPKVVSHLTLGQ